MTLDQEQRQKISRIVAILLFGGYALIASKLIHVQVTAADLYASQQDSMMARPQYRIGNALFERGLRGSILSSDGVSLALGFDTHRLVVDPGMNRRPGTLPYEERLNIAFRALESVGIDVDYDAFMRRGRRRYHDRIDVNGQLRQVKIRRRVLYSGLLPYQREYLRQLFSRTPTRQALPDFSFEAESKREYPQGALVAEVVGFVARSEDDAENRARGRAGVEFMLDRLLSGEHGEYVCESDGAGREFDQDGRWKKLPEDGHDVVLSLDIGIQAIADEAIRKIFEEHDCQAVTAIVQETQTGRILAMRSYPSFAVEDVYEGRISPKDTACRPFVNTYPPGSTMKPFIVAYALEQGLVRWDQEFDLRNRVRWFRLGNRRRRVSDAYTNGILDLEGVLRKSSNIAMAEIGLERLKLDGMFDALEAFGFREKCRLLLPQEANPIFATRETANPIYFPTSVSFGQEISLTPLQMLAKFSIFGTGGIYHEPKVVDWVGKGSDRTENDRPSRRLLREGVAVSVKAALAAAVEDGTGRILRGMPWTVAAKTGTAEIFAKTGEKLGYSSSMMALVPASAPRFSIWVGVHELNGEVIYGGRVAGPAVREIIEKTMRAQGVPGDRMDEDEGN